MDTQNIILFSQALKIVTNNDFKALGSNIRTDTLSSSSICKHEETSEENGKKTCLECGQLLEENYIASHHSTHIIGMKQRRKTESSIYNDIPFYIERNIKDMTNEIYQKATASKIFRNTSKRSIILASLYRASAIAGNHISYSDLLEMFLLKPHEADKGFNILSKNISKKSEFTIKFNQSKEDIITIHSKLKKLGMDDPFMYRLIVNTFNLVKEKSDIVNTSQPNSIICGCIYFWIIYNKIKKSDEEFSKTVGISKMTLLKVYVAVCDIVFKTILKDFFVILFKNCEPKPIVTPIKFKNVIKRLNNVLYEPNNKIIIHNPFDTNKIRATPNSRINTGDLPLDEVDDTQEWNVLLNQNYYNLCHIYMMNVKLIRKNDKEMYFDLTEYNKKNNIDAFELLKSLLINCFNKDYEISNIESDDEHAIKYRNENYPNLPKSNII